MKSMNFGNMVLKIQIFAIIVSGISASTKVRQLGDKCSQSKSCNSDAGLICTNHRCTCMAHYVFYEFKTRKCVALVGGYCNPGHKVIGRCPLDATCKVPSQDLSEEKHLGNIFLPDTLRIGLETIGFIGSRHAKQCICDNELIPDAERKACISTLKYNDTCTRDAKAKSTCDVLDGLTCGKTGICACDTPEKKYSDIWNRCYTVLGAICQESTQCGENAICSTLLKILDLTKTQKISYKQDASKRGTCACVTGYKPDTNGGCDAKGAVDNIKIPKRRPDYCKNVTCDAANGLNHCNPMTGQCECRENYLFFEKETNRCVAHTGGYCNPANELIKYCPKGSTCKLPEKSEFLRIGRNVLPESLVVKLERVGYVGKLDMTQCVCNEGLVPDIQKQKCVSALKFDESCLQDAENDGGLFCDASAGLFCETHGTCACMPGKIYSEKWNKCYSPINTPCTDQTQCGWNAICSSLLKALEIMAKRSFTYNIVEKTEGVCVCVEGFTMSLENGECVVFGSLMNTTVTNEPNWIKMFLEKFDE